MATVSLLGGLLMLSGDASADSADAPVAPVTDSQAPANTGVNTADSSVVLSTSASAAPVSSVSAEVSASSASSVAPVSVSTSTSVVSTAASLSASQSLPGSVVVPAEAVEVMNSSDAAGSLYRAYVLPTNGEEAITTNTPLSSIDVVTSTAMASADSLKFSAVGNSHVTGTDANGNSVDKYVSNAITNFFTHTGSVGNVASLGAKPADKDGQTAYYNSAYALLGVDQATNTDFADSYLKTATGLNFEQLVAESMGLSITDETVKVKTSSYLTSYYNAIKGNTTLVDKLVNGAKAAVNAKGVVSKTVDGVEMKNGAITGTLIPDDPAGETIAAYTDQTIDWQTLTAGTVGNAAGTLSYRSKLDMKNAFHVQGAYKVAYTTSSSQDMYNGVFGGQAIGFVLAPVAPADMGTNGMSNTFNLNNNDAIATIPNAVFAGRDLYVSNPGDVNTALVHINHTDSNGVLYSTQHPYTSYQTAPDSFASGYAYDKTPATTLLNDKTVAPDKSNLYGSAFTPITSYPEDYTNTAGTYYIGSGTSIDKVTTSTAVIGKTSYPALLADTALTVQNYLYDGVFFDVQWIPDENVTEVDGKVSGTLIYAEYTSAGTDAGTGKPRTFATQIGRVESHVSVDAQMAVGLYGANGGNQGLIMGGISYFQGTNAAVSVPVEYQFKDKTKVADETNISAAVGQIIQIDGVDGNEKPSDGNKGMVVSYGAPKIDGLTIDNSVKLDAVSGMNGGIAGTSKSITIVYKVNQQSFTDQITLANDAVQKIENSITTLQEMDQANPSDDIKDAIDGLKSTLEQAKGIKTSMDNDYSDVEQATWANTYSDVKLKLEAAKESVKAADDLATSSVDVVTETINKLTNNSISDSDDVKKAITNYEDGPKSAADVNNLISTINIATISAAASSAAAVVGNNGLVVSGVVSYYNDIIKNTGKVPNIASDLAAISLAAGETVPANIADDSGVTTAASAYVNSLVGVEVNGSAFATLESAMTAANKTLQSAKDGAASDEKSWATDKSKYADQDQTKLDKIESDAKNLNGLTAADNTSATAKTIDAARKQLQDDIKVVNDLRQVAVTAANTAVTDVEQHKDELAERIAAVEDATKNGTQQAIEKAVEDLKAADTVATDTVVPTNMSDDDGVTTAKDAVTAALNAKTKDV